MTQNRRPPQHSSSCDPDCCNQDCYDPDYSGRRTGGRVGGRYFSSNSSTSSPPIKPSSPSYTDKDSSTSKSKSSNIDDDLLGMIGAAVIVIVIGFIILPYVWEISGQNDPLKTSVVMLQVGLHGTARSVQKTLDQITEEADTSKREGLSPILTETALAMLRKQDYWISCFSSVDVKKSSEDGEKRFLELGTEERAKFEEETLVKVNNVKKKRTRIQSVDGFGNEYIVITILVSTKGVYKLPVINNSAKLKVALLKLASLTSKEAMAVQAVEVLWTPQQENDSLSKKDLLNFYPLLKHL